MLRPTIQDVRSIGNPASTYRWGMAFIKLPVLGYLALALSNELNLRCTSTDVPKATGSSIPINIRGYKAKIPGDWNYTGSITLTFVESSGSPFGMTLSPVSTFLQTWRNACWDADTGVQNKKSDADGIVLLTRLNSQDEPIWLYTLKGVFLEDYDPTGGMMGGESEILRPTATLSYDTFEDGMVPSSLF